MKYFIYLILIILFSACEFEIHPELAAPEEVLVIDAFLTDKQETQTINITRSQPYFETTKPEKVSGLTVLLEDLTSGHTYTFLEGEEHYYLEVTSPIAIVGHTYRLEVESDEASFEAFVTMKRVPLIDSIGFEYNEPNFLVDQNHFTAQFYAVDPKGVGDCYWIKGWKNGSYFNKPEELNMAYDASVSPGQPIDGQLFVFPVRAGFINPYGNDDDPESTDMVPPYEVGDSLYVEIHSIDRAAFDFLYALYFQINRPGGFGEIFSSPLSNVSTNIRNMNPTSSINVAGFFSMSAVSASGRKLTEEIAHEAETKYFNQ